MEVFELISQASPHADIGSLQGWLQVLSNLGFGGIAWYLIAYAMPKIQERFDAHSDKQQQAFLAESERLRTSHESTIERIVEQHQRQQELLVQSIRDSIGK